ncbi:MAG: hypothetical protein Q9190_002656 [Brigantiaea leucoxantha]
MTFDLIDLFIKLADGQLPRDLNYEDWDLNPIGDTDLFAPGERIMCSPNLDKIIPAGGVCVFTQYIPPGLPKTSGATVKQKLRQLQEHGCKACGSVPLSSDNDPREAGILTVNAVGGKVCGGECIDEELPESGRFAEIS